MEKRLNKFQVRAFRRWEHNPGWTWWWMCPIHGSAGYSDTWEGAMRMVSAHRIVSHTILR